MHLLHRLIVVAAGADVSYRHLQRIIVIFLYKKGVVDGNYRVEIYIHFFRPNQEQLRKL